MARDRLGVIGDYRLKPILAKAAPLLAQHCGIRAVELFVSRFAESTGQPEADASSYVWRSAIEEHEQDAHKEGYRGVIINALRDTVLAIATEDGDVARKAIQSLLRSPYPTIVRVGVFVCGERYGSIGHVFWTEFKPEWFVETNYWHEVYWLIKKAFMRFSGSERARFLEAVRTLKGKWRAGADEEAMDDEQRRDLLHAAAGQGDKEVEEMYTSLVTRYGQVREHPDFHIYSSAGWVGERSPIDSAKLVQMSGPELLEELRRFQPNKRDWEGPTLRGFATSLSAAVRVSEDGFASRLAIFRQVPRAYQHGLFRGLKDRWAEDKRAIDWNGAIGLAEEILREPGIAEEVGAPNDGWEPNIFWLLSDISDLIKSGAAKNDRPLPREILVRACHVLRSIVSVSTTKPADQAKDAVSHAINSARGRALESLIISALALRRQGLGASETWSLLGELFDSELILSELGENADFAAIGGLYTPNLHYLNPEWLEANFDRIFSLKNEAAWACAAKGFAYQRHMYDWLYRRLIDGGHLRRMIFADIPIETVTDKAIQFLGLAYLKGFESLDAHSLLAEMISEVRTEQLSSLAWFFWTLRDSPLGKEHSPLILAFWYKVAGVLRRSSQAYPELHSNLSLLAAFFDEFDDTAESAFSEAAPYANVKHHGYVLVENVARLAAKYPRPMARVLTSALKGFVPDYKREDLVSAVKDIAKAGEVEAAERICNEFASKGSGLLKNVYADIRSEARTRK